MKLLLVLTIIICINLQFLAVDCGILDGPKFRSWLKMLKGSSKPSGNQAALDQLDKDIFEYNKNSNFKKEIPEQLSSVNIIKLDYCNESLPKRLTPPAELKDSNSPGGKYFAYYSKLQFNLCVQNSELERAKLASQKIDKSKWILWYETFLEDANPGGKDIEKESAQKLATYLKRYVPKIEKKNFASPDEHKAKIASIVQDLIKDICPIITRTSINLQQNPKLAEYYDKNRQAMIGEEMPRVWSTSFDICSSDSMKNVLKVATLTKNVNEYFESQLDSIEVEEKNLNDVADANMIKQLLFDPTSEPSKSAKLLRMGNPIELLEKMSKLPGDDHQIALELLEMTKMPTNEGSCDLKTLDKRVESSRKFTKIKNSQVSSYVKAINSLFYGACDRFLRFKAAILATNIPSNQLGRLEELRQLLLKYQEGSIENPQFIHPDVGFGKPLIEFIERYQKLKAKELNTDHFNTYMNSMDTDMFDTRDSAGMKHTSNKDDGGKRRTLERFGQISDYTCANVTKYLTRNDGFSMRDLIWAQKGEQLGQVTLQLFDYAIMCNHFARDDALKSFKDGLKSKFSKN